MRIIGGIAAGRRLRSPKGFDVRPTPDLVRQAVFNSLGDRVVGAEVLELFAGTGALGLECVSRGASRLVAVEKSQKQVQFIRDNFELVRSAGAGLEVRTQDAFTAVGQLAQNRCRFGLIMADPPYGEKNIGRRSVSFAQRLLDDLSLPGLLATDGLFVLGHTRRDTLEVPAIWVERKQMRHGDTMMRFLARAAVADGPNAP